MLTSGQFGGGAPCAELLNPHRCESEQMSTTFDRLADIIAENTDVDRGDIMPDSHLTEDLGLDSIDMFDVTFAIDKAFDVEVPVEEWTDRVEKGEQSAEHYFVMRNFCLRIDELVAEKTA